MREIKPGHRVAIPFQRKKFLPFETVMNGFIYSLDTAFPRKKRVETLVIDYRFLS